MTAMNMADLDRLALDFESWGPQRILDWASRRWGERLMLCTKIAADPVHPGLVKLAPLADWSAEALWSYVRARRVPYHDLYDQGYTSIGCDPCTRAVQAHESGRDGRWWWEEGAGLKECGLHVPGLSVATGTEA